MEREYKLQNRIETALNMRNMKQIDLVDKTGIRKSAINNWVKHRCQPKQEPLNKMAKVLDVSPIWLAGYNVPMDSILQDSEGNKILTEVVNDIQGLDYQRLLMLKELIETWKK